MATIAPLNPALDTPVGQGGAIDMNSPAYQAATPNPLSTPNSPAVTTPSTITSATMAPQQSFNVTPPAPATQSAGLQAYMGANAAQLQQEKTAADSSKHDLLTSLLGSDTQTGLTDKLYADSVDPAKASLDSINNKIVAEQQSARAQIDALKLNPQGLFGTALQDKIDEINSKSTFNQANLAVTQMAAQGQYADAKAIADRAVQAVMEKEKVKNDALQFNYTENKDLFTKDEQRAFETAQQQRQTDAANQEYRLRAQFDQTLKQSDPLYKAQLTKANADAASDTPSFLGQQLATGLLAPSELSKRATGSGAYNAALKAADDYSMQTTGKHFDIAKADRDYKFANNANTQNTLNYLGSLVGSPGQPGNLDSLKTLSNSVTRTSFPALNDAAAWTRLQTGDPTIVAYNATVTEVADQIAKVLQGGGTGSGTSDAKLAQASALFQRGFTKDQVNATIDAIKPLLQNRGKNIVNDNPYLSDYAEQFGIDQKPAADLTKTANTKNIPDSDLQAAIQQYGEEAVRKFLNQ